MKLTRREFIKASAATSGMLAYGLPAAKPVSGALVVRTAKPAAPGEGEWVSTAC